METPNRSALRQQLRHKRRSLSRQQQHLAAANIDRVIANSGVLLRHKDIAFYLANDGEINPALVLKRAHLRGLRCYLPIVTANNQLRFARYRPGDKLINNHFGIAEPAKQQPHRKVWSLGLVLLPLVGFDRQGTRLGMGGGYYDRSFQTPKSHAAMPRPHLVGLAHQCQEVSRLDLQSWDIPLSQIITDKEVISVEKLTMK